MLTQRHVEDRDPIQEAADKHRNAEDTEKDDQQPPSAGRREADDLRRKHADRESDTPTWFA
jgi:hypothetical protein